jgi:hypothetical protein
MNFSGEDYRKDRDKPRLTSQYQRIFALMADSKARSYEEIARVTGYPVPSIAAQLRNMRKESFGKHTVIRTYVKNGFNLYTLYVNDKSMEQGELL